MGQRVISSSKLNFFEVGEEKSSLIRANKFLLINPKPGDLSMSRVKIK